MLCSVIAVPHTGHIASPTFSRTASYGPKSGGPITGINLWFNQSIKRTNFSPARRSSTPVFSSMATAYASSGRCSQKIEQALGAHAFPVAHRVFAGGYLKKYPAGSSRWIAFAMTASDGSGSESGQGNIGTTWFYNRWRAAGPQSARIAAARAPSRISVDDAATVFVVASSTVPPYGSATGKSAKFTMILVPPPVESLR